MFLTDAESRTVPPSPVDLAANGGRLSANGTGALGLVIAPNALLSGTVVGVVDGVPSAEACGSECQRRGWGPGGLGFPGGTPVSGCNVFNFCGQDSCRYCRFASMVLDTMWGSSVAP